MSNITPSSHSPYIVPCVNTPIITEEPKPKPVSDPIKQALDRLFTPITATKVGSTDSAVPLILIFLNHIDKWLPTAFAIDPTFFSPILDFQVGFAMQNNKIPNFNDFLKCLYLSLYEFKEKNDPTKIVLLLNRLVSKFLQLNKSNPNKLDQNFKIGRVWFDIWLIIFQNKRSDLLRMPVSSLCNASYYHRPENQNGQRVAVKSCVMVMRGFQCAMENLRVLRQAVHQLDPVIVSTAIKKYEVFFKDGLKNDTTFTSSQKIDFYIILKSFISNFYSKNKDFYEISKRRILDISSNYTPSLLTHESNRISGTVDIEKTDLSESIDDDTRRYIEQHREVFQNFVPRIEEIKDWMLNSCSELEELVKTVRYFYLYFRLGNLTNLKERIETEGKCNLNNTKQILSQEINIFIDESKDNCDLKIKIVKVLTEPNSQLYRTLYKLLATYETLYSETPIITQSTLGAPISFAKNFTDNFFIKKPSVQSLKSPYVLNSINEKGTTAPPSSSLDSAETQEFAETTDKPINNTESVISFVHQLQKLKSEASMTFSELRGGLKTQGLGANEALENAYINWCRILGTCKRLVDHKEQFTDQELAGYILDIIRDGTLAVEQTLACLERCVNPAANRQELKDRMTHNLVHILFHSIFNNRPVSADVRQAIHDLNRGEIIMRDLRNCKINRGVLQNLLAKTRFNLSGSAAFSTDTITADLFQFLLQSSKAYFEIQKYIAHGRIPNSNSFLKKIDDQQDLFIGLINQLQPLLLNDQADDKIIIKESGTIPSLDQIWLLIENFKEQVYPSLIADDLDELVNNMLLQLEHEMQFHGILEPVDMHHHVSKIVLLNQMIAERFILNLLDAHQISYDLEEVDHNLSLLVVKLGLNQKDFSDAEWDFLSKGKSTRLISRYPATYFANNRNRSKKRRQQPPLAKSIEQGIQASRSEIFQEELLQEQGFQRVDSKWSKPIADCKKLVLDDINLLRSIMAKISDKKLKNLQREHSPGPS